MTLIQFCDHSSKHVCPLLKLGIAGLFFASCLFTQFSLAEESASDRLDRVIGDAWQFQLRENPLFATRVGESRYNDRLPATSLDDAQRRAEVKQGFLDRLSDIERADLPASARINYDIFARKMRDEIAEFRFDQHLLPVDHRSGLHTTIPELGRRVPLATVQDYENYLARLSAFPAYVDGTIELMRTGIRAGVTQPAVIFERFREPLEAQIVESTEDSVLYDPFKEFPAAIPEAEHERLQEAGRKAIAESIVPGFERFLTFMESEYVPNCRTSVGASSLPDGRDFYRHRVRKFTTLDTTPEEIHAKGLEEVARIRGEMQRIMDQVEFEGELSDFFEHLRTDPQFYAKSADELMMHVAYALKKMDGRLPELFGRLPKMPYGLKEVPDYIAPQTTAAYYEQPSGDGRKAGFYFMNTYNLSSRPLYTVEALSLHEAVPGHHLQIALQQEMGDYPDFRRFTGFTAFVEGWALYAERLGLEVGFYSDPYSDFGRLTMEMWRACRLVVDTGMHYYGWTREQAINYMADNSALSMHNIRAEVDRYIGWPGQALAYKVGELKIRELRGMAEQELGTEFDVRAFHDTVLGSGAVPLDVLEQIVTDWVDSVR